MRVLVTGASGFVGRNLINDLKKNGHIIFAVSRSAYEHNADEFCIIDEVNEHSVNNLPFKKCEIVIHLAARVHVMKEASLNPLSEFLQVNLDATLHIAKQAVSAGIKRFVYVSSVKVNGEFTNNKGFTEEIESLPEDPYAISKWQAEQALMELSKSTGMEVVVVRPPLVYGPGVKANFLSLLNIVHRRIPLPLGTIKNARSMIYVGNLVDALICCASHPNAAGKTFLVCDDESPSTPELVRLISMAFNQKACIFFFPLSIMKLLANLLGRTGVVDRLTQSLMIDSGKIRNELNWVPPYTMAQGLKATAEWYVDTIKGKR